MTATSYCGSLKLFREYALTHPERIALSFATTKESATAALEYTDITYSDLENWSDSLAHDFKIRGIQQATRTIVLVKPGPELYAILLALFKIGAVPVIIDPGMGLTRMLGCLSAVSPQAFIGIPEAHAARVLFKYKFRGIHTKITVGKRWFWGGHKLQTLENILPTKFSSESIGGDRELLMIAFTTGSTGPAKAVEMTHGNLAAMITQTQQLAQREAFETSLITLPMFGVLDLIQGASIVLPPLTPSKVRETNPRHIVEAINRFQVQTMFASPAVLVPLLVYCQNNKISLPSIRAILSGGAPVPAEVIVGLQQLLGEKAKVYAGYGSTEALPIAAIEARELLDGLIERTKEGHGTCLGYPALNLETRIITITDSAIPQWHNRLLIENSSSTKIGEIVVSGPNVSTHYYWPPEANASGKIIENGKTWHRTGDLGWIDEAGRIWFCGRKSQRLETSSGPMFTVQIEQIFNTVPGIVRTALVGSGKLGAQQPVLCIETREDNQKELLIALRERGAQFPLTRHIDTFLFHPAFPVDIRHNAKIGREELTVWANKKIGK